MQRRRNMYLLLAHITFSFLFLPFRCEFQQIIQSTNINKASVLASFPSRTVTYCYIKCQQTPGCVEVSYTEDKGIVTCYLMREAPAKPKGSSTETEPNVSGEINTIRTEKEKKANEGVNECLQNNGGCDHQCIDTPKSFHCSCRTGYTLHCDGQLCLDVNECKINNGGCEEICENTPGGFNCSCRECYKPQGNGSCVETDECAALKCDSNAVCTKVNGACKCTCDEGWVGDGTVCKRTTKMLPMPKAGVDEAGRPYVQGYVEIQHNGTWGSICRDKFMDNENGAVVLCRMMGLKYGRYGSQYVMPYYVHLRKLGKVRAAGENNTPRIDISLDDVVCKGDEKSILDCSHKGWGNVDCSSSMGVVGVRCYDTVKSATHIWKVTLNDGHTAEYSFKLEDSKVKIRVEKCSWGRGGKCLKVRDGTVVPSTSSNYPSKDGWSMVTTENGKDTLHEGGDYYRIYLKSQERKQQLDFILKSSKVYTGTGVFMGVKEN